MNFKELLEKLGASAVKTLTDAKALLAEAHTAFSALVLDFEAKATALVTAQEQITALNATVAELNGKVQELTASLATETERANTAVTGTIQVLGSAGIVVTKLEVGEIKQAATARAEAIGHELLAARGIKPLPEQLKPADEALDANLSTDAGILAAYMELKPGSPESIAFSEKHRDALWRAQSARK
jgi:uncharacterized phage infection (PIP) family protein YhgE